ncbi:uncharacterized protein LACBIDRAFT_296876 [Laccaria bicolor S238N-H82]|uniref:Predicted protein n=1 Tax=Laccaria bicolor (strain S238N-H82 / ATCC MYA-4686) TaxID=486041 RepID=B0D9G8_LACBS|nr:uncharacterized protein LACBIDRAFT_296876 [Laccaria bicolor S238N-H82]EDR08350.1 predicted protein [Laccaria bicolor S238N-H82]|eukprot:XP_001880575.1 predicted protein [Laccaria bicolor S238N-H82]
MPAKYSHVRKKSTSGLLKKGGTGGPNGHHIIKETHHPRPMNPHIDRSITQAMSAVSQLERAIARILLLRYEHDMARLFSTRLYSIALVHLPTFVMRCASLGGPGWLAYNHDCDEIKDFFRAVISMDMREAGERVATKSVLWSYTALRHFALSNSVPICNKKGLHSLRLLPFFPALKAHLDSLEAMPPATFTKPPHLGSLQEGQDALEDACELKHGGFGDVRHPDWDGDWRLKIRVGYERLSQTLWKVAREFDVRGYGMVLREKLTTKWCDCGCSTDHLGEVCEGTVREDEEDSGVRFGKQKEWDGRGSGVYGWETEDEEDIWEIDLDFGSAGPEECEGAVDSEMTIVEMMEWRFLKAEREKEQGNAAFRRGEYKQAVKSYEEAHEIEPELPHYQLNLAAAHLKLNNWMEAEKACTKALSQHRSTKGLFRRARARRMLGQSEEAIADLRAIIRLQPHNAEALAELLFLLPPIPEDTTTTLASSTSKQPTTTVEAASALLAQLGIHKPKKPKPIPFLRTKADNRKLKITAVPQSSTTINPASIFSGVEFEEAGQGQGRTCGSNDMRNRTSRPGKEKASSAKTREMERLRGECAPYLSWDRYSLRKAD